MVSLMQKIARSVDAVLGRGEAAVTVPPMDGALQPNQALENARELIKVRAPDNLVNTGTGILFSSGEDVFSLNWSTGATTRRKHFDAPVSALAALPGEAWAAGLTNGEIRIVGGPTDGAVFTNVGNYRCHCPTALLAAPDGTLLVAEGSSVHRPQHWKHDLMSKGESGSVWRLNLAKDAATCLAARLAYPNALAFHSDGSVIVSESWRHRLLKLAPAGGSTVVLSGLPGYPARLAPATDGGYWLAVFAPRSQLIEFVLREDQFLSRMMAEIAEEHWVAPALSSGGDFREPLQGGAIKSMGVLKPWAPARSYGLLVKLDDRLFPAASFHSRADGHRHGITSSVEVDGQILITSKGGDAILSTPSVWLTRHA